jgi:hypothetical protein
METVADSAIQQWGVAMTITTALILLFATAYYFLKPRSAEESVSKKVKKKSGARNPYLATSISAEGCACAAVGNVANTRFLTSQNVPKLPLADCISATCKCRYVHHQDRRNSEGERRTPFSLQTDLYNLNKEVERRVKKGRRDTDWSGNAASELSYAEFEWNN